MSRSPGWRLSLAGALSLAYVLLTVAGSPTTAGALRLVVGLGAAAVALVIAARRSTKRSAWWLIAIGLATSAAGDLLWAGYELLGDPTVASPWISDVAYVVAWAAIVTGVSLLVADPVPARRLSARLDLADTFRLTTVAEGIESDVQLAALAAQGCDLGQGYLFSRPLPPDALVVRLAAQAGAAVDETLVASRRRGG